MPEPTPESPITELAAGAAQVHELYTAYVDAGFTESQALRLVISILTAGAGGSA
jgi:hypothetical protein